MDSPRSITACRERTARKREEARTKEYIKTKAVRFHGMDDGFGRGKAARRIGRKFAKIERRRPSDPNKTRVGSRRARLTSSVSEAPLLDDGGGKIFVNAGDRVLIKNTLLGYQTGSTDPPNTYDDYDYGVPDFSYEPVVSCEDKHVPVATHTREEWREEYSRMIEEKHQEEMSAETRYYQDMVNDLLSEQLREEQRHCREMAQTTETYLDRERECKRENDALRQEISALREELKVSTLERITEPDRAILEKLRKETSDKIDYMGLKLEEQSGELNSAQCKVSELTDTVSELRENKENLENEVCRKTYLADTHYDKCMEHSADLREANKVIAELRKELTHVNHSHRAPYQSADLSHYTECPGCHLNSRDIGCHQYSHDDGSAPHHFTECKLPEAVQEREREKELEDLYERYALMK